MWQRETIMIRKVLPIALTLSVVLGAGCSTAKVRVMPGENGLNRVVVRDIERDDAEEEAVESANEYCEKRKKTAVFVNKDKTQYTGSMDESTRNTVRKASTAAMVLGGIGVAPSRTRSAGSVLGSAGTIGRIMTSDRDYQTEVEFKCE